MNTVRDVSQILQQIEKWEFRDKREKRKNGSKPKNISNGEKNLKRKGGTKIRRKRRKEER